MKMHTYYEDLLYLSASNKSKNQTNSAISSSVQTISPEPFDFID